MEDAMIINKGSYDRGFAHGSVYKTEVTNFVIYYTTVTFILIRYQRMHIHGSHSDWKAGKHFLVREKSGNFAETGEVGEFYPKYWKNQEKKLY